MPQNASIHATERLLNKFEQILRDDPEFAPEIERWSTYIGQGAIRFYLPLNVQLPNPFFAQTVETLRSLPVSLPNGRTIPLSQFAVFEYAILGMIPIAPTVFWGSMAFAIMGGLAVASLLTLVFLPTLYVTWFGGVAPGRDGTGPDIQRQPKRRIAHAMRRRISGIYP
nr:hypothetical protein [uncultured Thiocystis sp.]